MEPKCCNKTSLKRFVQVIKLVALITCTAAFGWKVIDSYFNFMAKGTGTNIEIRLISKAPETQFLVCRHQEQVFHLYNSNAEGLLWKYNLTISEMTKMKAYRIIEAKGDGYEEAFKSFQFRDPKVLKGIKIARLGEFKEYIDDTNGYDMSSPPEPIFHPLFGNCFPINPDVMMDKHHGISHIKITIDYRVGFPVFPPLVSETLKIIRQNGTRKKRRALVLDKIPVPTNGTSLRPWKLENLNTRNNLDIHSTTTLPFFATEIVTQPKIPGYDLMTIDEIRQYGRSPLRRLPGDKGGIDSLFHYPSDQKYRYNESGFGSFVIMAADPRAIYMSKAVVLLSSLENEYYSLTHETLDKTDISHVALCEDRPDYNEDLCLNQCLTEKFVKEFGCLHARLSQLSLSNLTLKKRTPFCRLKHFKSHLQICEHEKEFDNVTDPGLNFIRETLVGFEDPAVEIKRCGCKHPCKETRLKVFTWKSEMNTADPKRKSVFALFMFSEDFKAYSYHMLYTGSDFLADIGGYLGLFLGLSIFGLVELLGKIFHCNNKNPFKKSNDEDDVILTRYNVYNKEANHATSDNLIMTSEA